MPGIIKTMSTIPAKRSADLYLISENDIIYENDLLRNPGTVKPWLEYVTYKRQYGSPRELAFVLERAVTALPRSYKLWKIYLEFRIKHLQGKNAVKYAAQYSKVNALFERALVLLNKMPRIWQMYLEFLLKQPQITATRQTFDRALRALPTSQHNRIWALYRPFARSASGDTCIKIWRRYMQVHPEDAEEFIELLITLGRYPEAIQKYIEILNNPKFKSKEAKGPFEFWTEMLELLIDHAREIESGEDSGIDVEKIIRSGITRFPDQRGILWAGLGRYWLNMGNSEKARDTFEEGIMTVMTVRDFTIIFDLYAEAEETVISILMSEAAARSSKGTTNEAQDADLDIRLMRFEQLMDRRPFLLNDVLLRQNPNNVLEWEKRVALWGDNKKEAVAAYTDAIAAINPKRAIGSFHGLWTAYAKLYEEGGDLRNARIIMEKAVKVPFKSTNELAEM